MKIIEVVKKRTSVRSYKNQELSNEIREDILNHLNNTKGPFNVNVRFSIVDLNDKSLDNLKLGTYGIIRGCNVFIATAVKKDPRSMEQLGYRLESGILYAASKGLGTCWLGGTFKREEFKKAINLKDEEILPIITPIGYAREGRSIIDSIVKFSSGSKNRKGFEEIFYNKGFQNALSRKDAGMYEEAFEAVRLAPSAVNAQPWRIIMDNNKFHFYIKRKKAYKETVPYDIQKIDIGIAMCHFELAINELGFKGKWIEDGEAPKGEAEYIISFEI